MQSEESISGDDDDDEADGVIFFSLVIANDVFQNETLNGEGGWGWEEKSCASQRLVNLEMQVRIQRKLLNF